MDVVIRGTKTIEEFKQVRENMLRRADRYSRKHIASCERGSLWIEYESGHAWQYAETESGLEWF